MQKIPTFADDPRLCEQSLFSNQRPYFLMSKTLISIFFIYSTLLYFKMKTYTRVKGAGFRPLKDEVEFWSCDCIVKETVWNRPEKVDHLAYKNLCVLQGSGIIKMIRNVAKSSYSYKHLHRKMYMGLNEHVA